MLHAKYMKTILIKTNSLIGCLLLLALLAGCRETEPKIENHSKAFVTLKDVEGIFYDIRDGGSIQYSYKMKADYPATSVITEISNQLKTAGWQPLKEDYLNPGLPSSHVRGWTYFEDASRPPTRKVHQWMGSWEDKYGNIVTYICKYEYPKNEKKNLSDLQIHQIYEPASLVALIKRELQKQ